MKTQLCRLLLFSTAMYLICLNLPAVSIPASPSNETHLCGFSKLRTTSRRYARTFSNRDIGAPRTVRLIYFLPADRQPNEDIERKMDALIKDVREFYADQMENHGFGRRTFNIETDHSGKAVVHRVYGQYFDSYYQGSTERTFYNIWNEIHQRFDTSQNIYLAAVDVSSGLIGEVAGVGSTYRDWGGFAAIPASGRFFNHPLAAHELGHTFGLRHDFRSSKHIMSYGPWGWGQTTTLSRCAVKSLQIQKYFNPAISIKVWNTPTIGLVSPRTYSAGAENVSIKFRVTDFEGLHQVLLFGSEGLTSCREFKGEQHSFVEFDYDGDSTFNTDNTENVFVSLADRAVHPIRAVVVDTDGNKSETDFNLFPETLQTLTKISGDNQPPGLPNVSLPIPFVVELRDVTDGSPISGVWVTFSVVSGGGTLNSTGDSTDASGRAGSTLMLGPNLGTNTVDVSALGFTVTFNAVAESPVVIPDPNLRTVIEKSLKKAEGEPISQAEMATLTYTPAGTWSIGIRDLTGLEYAVNFTHLDLRHNSISNISPLANLINLKQLALSGNSISDLSPLSGLAELELLYLGNNAVSDISEIASLTNLELLFLEANRISEIWSLTGLTNLRELKLSSNSISNLTPLTSNAGLGNRDKVNLRDNLLSYPSIHEHIPTLQARGVEIFFDHRTPTVLVLVSGNNQTGDPGAVLLKSFVVQVKDANGLTFEGVPVTFAVTAGGGSLSVPSTTTDSDGRAESILTLGQKPGINTVSVRAEKISQPLTFNAEGVRTAIKLVMISGDDQVGLPGEALEKPFVVEVEDQTDNPLPEVEVSFAVTSGDGTLSETSTTTDSNGRAESTLTLGQNPGTNTVEATVTGTEEKLTFTAEGIRIPKALNIISGMDQVGLPGEPLEKPFVVKVRDQTGKPLPEIEVTFAVTSGDGTLSETSTTTDANGRAEITLTLGTNPGKNTVEATVTGTEEKLTFTAEGIRIPKALNIISGMDQAGLPGETLEKPFVVEVRDQTDNPLPDVEITFKVTSGDGTLSETNTTTDSNGRAESTLTLGPSPGINTVESTVTGTEEKLTFTAQGIRIPKTLEVVSGADQKGLPGETLEKPFVVEVRDHTGKPLPEVEVTFTVTSGDGTLSETSTTTDSNGRAESTLTLGQNPGTNTVEATVTGIDVKLTFTAEGIRIPKTLEIISGVDQQGLPGETLEKPFVVEVRDQTGKPLPEIEVTFAVTSGDGTLSETSTTTDANGRAESTLTLGDKPGTNTVESTVTGIDVKLTFTAEGIRIPKTLEIISGVDQQGLPGETLEKPFVVEVRDQTGKPLPEIEVTFAVTSGDGTLSETSTTTDANGRAESTLTLGDKPGTNTVESTVTGIDETLTFTAEGIRIPKILEIVSGMDQKGLPGEPLEKPFVVEVRDQTDNPLPDVEITFKVTSGDGALSETSTISDSNGRAESTLTLGQNSRLHTVEVSTLGVEPPVIFSAGVKRREFVLSVPIGSSLIHIPLRVTAIDGEPANIESVGDLYDALGGSDAVNLLTTRNPQTQQWHSYLGDASRGEAADPKLTDDKGIIASMRVSVELRLVGDAHGQNGNSAITLRRGTNVVGVPLRDSRIVRVSDLLALEGIRDNVPVVTVSDNGEFKVVAKLGDDGDIPVTGGQSFIMVAESDATVAISGDGWGGFSATDAAPPLALNDINVPNATPVLRLTGSIVYEAGGRERNVPFAKSGLWVTVDNLVTGKMVTTGGALKSDGAGYQLTVVESASGRAAQIGDVLEVSAESSSPLIRVRSSRYTVTAADVMISRIQLPELVAFEIPTETELLPNFPNPFNPETWIPYQLAEDAEVKFTIYDSKGVTIRHLDLGHQLAGYYTDREKAAYWDGRNDNGESVASGLYFYQLGTPSILQFRRMVILK